jgi:hypothetical protein
MSAPDAAPTSDAAALDAPSDDAPHRDAEAGDGGSGDAGAWRPSAAWFAAEIAVVVVGVLIALALNAWWAGRQDAAREATYLRQLAADLERTEQQISIADSVSRGSERATAQLLRAYYRPQVPPADSVRRWLASAVSYSATRPVLGTAEALVATGDLGLVDDDSLRSAITSYLEGARSGIELQARFVTKWNGRVDELLRRFDLTVAFRETLPQAVIDSAARADPLFYLPAGPHRALPPIDPRAVVRDDNLRGLFFNMVVDRRNLRSVRRNLRENARRLRERVEARLARSAAP